MEADFSGWATKAGLKCSDGRTITPEAFKHMDGQTVPLVWQHGHNDPNNVLGHAILEHRDGEGVYAYGFFNDTPSGVNAKKLVAHKDIKNLSIFANQLVEKSKNVLHGFIREVSLVLSGANPGALIDFVAVQHADGEVVELNDEAVIYTGLELEHSDDSSSNDDKSDVEDKSDEVVEHADTTDDDEKSIQDIYDEMTEEQKEVVHFMVGAAVEAGTAEHSSTDDDDNISHQDQEGNTMTHNVFEKQGKDSSAEVTTLSHSQLEAISATARRTGSLREAFLAHAVEYGIENIDLLFPDAQAVDNTPELIARRQEWVSKVINGAKKAPFSRIKSLSADITHDEARAKGYVKGNLKKDEWFALQKRVTTPTTIYKKQKLDRDDIIEITDLDVVAWLKGEMRLMLDEEIARAVLVGDGREMEDEDKVDENCIRPIANDADFYAHRVLLPTNTVGGEAMVEAILRARPYYRGTGSPTLFLTEEFLTDLLLGRDKMGRRYYNSIEELRVALRVADIVTVDVMEGATTDNGHLIAILVNMADYTMGSTRGGQVSMFDDFDIDYNQYKYLIEGRMSGALTKFKSAVVFSRATGTLVNPTVPTFDTTTGVLTVPNQTGVVYRNADTDEVFAAGPQTAVAAGESISVEADPDTGYYFPANIVTDWTFTRSAG